MSRHPGQECLALYAGGELGLIERLSVALHARRCERCRAEVAAFRASSGVVRQRAMDLPEGVDWTGLRADMSANIRLGLAAGEAVEPVFRPARPQPLFWRAALVLGAATAVVVTGWFLNLPKPQADLASMDGVILETTQAGVGLKERGRAITLMHPGSEAVMTTVSVEGSVRAHFVDAVTGQVTVTNVYAE